MVTFDSEQIKKYIARVRLFSGLSVGAFVTAFCVGVFSAVGVGSTRLFAVTWIIASVAAVALVVFFTLLKLNEMWLSDCVAKVIAVAMEENSDLYTGDSEIALVAEYVGNNVTLYRQNSLKKIIFDLSGIKKSVRTYSNFGTRLLQFLEGYYFKHSEGYSNVTIADYFDKRNNKLDNFSIIENGEVCVYRPENNYFLKRGLIK